MYRTDRSLQILQLLPVALAFALILRVVLYIILDTAGYFYGVPWDTFSRTSLAWQWAQHPYFSPGDGFWVPLQFWLVGSVYRLIQPLLPASSLLVPVVVNNLFFVGSLIVTYAVAVRLASPWAGVLALLLATAFFAGDIFVSYSGLSEPILIFFVLLGSQALVRVLGRREIRAGNVWLAGLSAMLAAATHYVGWFFAIVVAAVAGTLMVREILRRDYRRGLIFAGSVVLAVAFPCIWMLTNYRLWGDPLHFAQLARELQAPYAGSLAIVRRLIIPPTVLAATLPGIIVPGIIALVVAGRRDPRHLLYAMPALVVFVMIWASTAAGFAAPHQEPRYLVFVGWALLPYIAALLVTWWRPLRRARVAPIMVAAVIGLIGLVQTFSFSNSFGPEVEMTARLAGRWLEQHGEQGRVIVEDLTFAERGVLPIVAGYPSRFILVPPKQLAERQEAPARFLDGLARIWLAVVKNGDFALAGQRDGLHSQSIGEYHILSREAITGR